MGATDNVQAIRGLVLGIDFGTTFSAVAYALHERNSNQQLSTATLNETRIHSVQFDFVESQVKTQLAWHEADQDYVWGDDVDARIRDKEISEDDRIVMLKLGLDETDATSDIRAKQAKQLSRIPPAYWGENSDLRQPVIADLISVYLERLYTYAKTKIIRHFGILAGGNIFDVTDVQCAICVPAIWTPEMNQVMVTAAEQAGIPNPSIVSESEAAAALIMLEHQQQAAVSTRALGPSASIIPHVCRHL